MPAQRGMGQVSRFESGDRDVDDKGAAGVHHRPQRVEGASILIRAGGRITVNEMRAEFDVGASAVEKSKLNSALAFHSPISAPVGTNESIEVRLCVDVGARFVNISVSALKQTDPSPSVLELTASAS